MSYDTLSMLDRAIYMRLLFVLGTATNFNATRGSPAGSGAQSQPHTSFLSFCSFQIASMARFESNFWRDSTATLNHRNKLCIKWVVSSPSRPKITGAKLYLPHTFKVVGANVLFAHVESAPIPTIVQ